LFLANLSLGFGKIACVAHWSCGIHHR
jgi:hypothetical protein